MESGKKVDLMALVGCTELTASFTREVLREEWLHARWVCLFTLTGAITKECSKTTPFTAQAPSTMSPMGLYMVVLGDRTGPMEQEGSNTRTAANTRAIS